MEHPDLGAANVDWVTERLTVGGDLDVFDPDLAARQASDLARAGITHVLDARLELDDSERWAASPAVSYLWDGFALLLALGWDPIDAITAIREARPEAFAAYAEDALRWHHQRTDADPERRAADQDRLRTWRRDHPLDLVRVLGEQREG